MQYLWTISLAVFGYILGLNGKNSLMVNVSVCMPYRCKACRRRIPGKLMMRIDICNHCFYESNQAFFINIANVIGYYIQSQQTA